MKEAMMHLTNIDEERDRRSALLLRTLPLSLIPTILCIAIALFIRMQLTPIDSEAIANPARLEINLLSVLAVVIILACSQVMLVRLGRPTVSATIFIGAWTLVTTILTIENGISSFWPAMMLLPICAAGILLDGLASTFLALLASFLVVCFAGMELHGAPLHSMIYPPMPDRMRPIFAASFWVAIFWVIAGLTGMLARGFRHALAQSREKTEELRRLSSELEERVAAQTAELARRAERAEVLYEVSRALATTLDLAKTLDLIARRAAKLLRFDMALILMVDEEELQLSIIGSYNAPTQLGTIIDIKRSDMIAVCHSQPFVIPIKETAALILPMHSPDGSQGYLALIAADGSAERSRDDLALAEGLADQAVIAITNAQLITQLRENATLEERTRLAREIHDTIAQELTGIVVQLSAAKGIYESEPAKAGPHLELARKMAREALAEARRSVWNLRTPTLERATLAEALATLASHSSGEATRITFEQRGQPWSIPYSAESALLRVAQESLANVAKHAQASAAQITLDYRDDGLSLCISDDGVGIDAARHRARPTPSISGGFGIIGMRERLEALGGRLDVTSQQGTQVCAWLPRQARPSLIEPMLQPAAPVLQVAFSDHV